VQQYERLQERRERTAVPKRNIDLMIGLAKAANDEEIAQAAAYFSCPKPRQTTRVVETDTVPKTFIMANHYGRPAFRREGSHRQSASSRCPKSSSNSRIATRTPVSSRMCR